MKAVVGATLFGLIAIWAALRSSYRFESTQPFQHVFINETDDHRFDEAIQTSILASANRTGVQNAVVISDRFTLTGLEEETNRLFSKLNLGRNNKGRAILYVLSPKNKALKIEVGYALEGLLPDGRIKDLELAAKTFIFSGRYQSFWAELINTLNIEIYDKEHRGAGADTNYDFSKHRFVSGGAGILTTDYRATPEMLNRESRKIKIYKQKNFAPSKEIRESLDRYLESLHEGYGDPNLALISAESRQYRNLTPMTTYQLIRNWDMYKKAGVDRIFADDKQAFVFFRPNHPVLPIVLIYEGGAWFVDEPLSHSLFHRFEDSMRVFLKYPTRWPSEATSDYVAKNLGPPIYNAPRVDLGKGFSDPLETYYFRYFWLDRLALEIEKWNLNSESDAHLWLAVDALTNLGFMSRMVEIYSELAGRHPQDETLRKNLAFYKNIYRFSGPQWSRTLPSE